MAGVLAASLGTSLSDPDNYIGEKIQKNQKFKLPIPLKKVWNPTHKEILNDYGFLWMFLGFFKNGIKLCIFLFSWRKWGSVQFDIRTPCNFAAKLEGGFISSDKKGKNRK